MCGFIGIAAQPGTDVSAEIYDGLISLQHRGQDAAGILSLDGAFHLRKQNGMVRDIFSPEDMARLKGNIAIGHVRYPTVGAGGEEDSQPFYINFPFGVGMAHNGNLTNFLDLKGRLFPQENVCLQTSCDLEAILYAFARAFQGTEDVAPLRDRFRAAVEGVFQRSLGAYSVVGILGEGALFAFRDPTGIKPLVIGRRDTPSGPEWAAASESVALDLLGFERVKDLANGESFLVTPGQDPEFVSMREEPHRPCVFELVYFARPDSMLDGLSVYKTRRRFGETLAKQWIETDGPQADVIIPIPDSSRDAALSMANFMGLPYREGFIKNRYVGRTFIMPDQEARQTSIRRKLNPIPLEFEGKDVLLVDDSIVRGNTSRKIIQVARKAGARKVYFATTSPPLRAPCPYGIDMATRQELVARDRSVEQIRREIDADHLIYLDIERMIDAAKVGNPDIEDFCAGCFTGTYPTTEAKAHLAAIEEERLAAQA